ncbi:conserved hypothetical protein [Vibrio nigripulchritudo SO65]|uniref:DUF1801 domain-containing protein n=1 Tax=Vibrio nigripulchritudo TaxID=28173 RepID=UPI0003B1ACAC|nr:DUF1801 domain-containing protein [Vibrio nigripulchritudo]CCN34355.1 conserved hypothetical protein [Vibrio nigripulchritudo AM115]CCN43053.1 conserved hypothetical protein [Vibrio nigripulchritudo FTn2]CCN65025.1 conserved hypothetical protein [Vibrio nigripulchritudo POn4]CCN73557.1 conserved hypothetical protein [Vibrio nigripulchritudo SFn118]CCN77806.1 conserved hypothetical protein [Vibrio nigripulchritudo SO65]
MDEQIQGVFDQFPKSVKEHLLQVRTLIFSVAEEHQLGSVEETLKWGQPSYMVKTGSTVRLGFDRNDPQTYCVYFHCQTTLVETFRELYGDEMEYQGNRAIVFRIDKPLAEPQLRHCLYLALNYHKLKHLPLLGA